MSLAQQQNLESTYLLNTYARKPVELVSGEGMRVFDDEGRAYLDFVSGVGAVSLGHCHPAVVEAVASQAEKLIHVSNYYYIENRGQVAKLLSDLLNTRVEQTERTPWKSFFANSGAEANECAIKLARLWAKKHKGGAQTIVTLDCGFHGRTLATLAATAQPAKQEAFQPLPAGFVHTPLNDIAALEALFAAEGENICAIMLECAQGESGVHPCTAEFLEAARRLTVECGALLICDEIQCGMYRCGTYPFGFQHFAITPDIVTIAKGVASGVPTGMCAARESVAAAFEPGDHGSTFGGSCLAVAAAQATIETLASLEVARSVEEVGSYLRKRLAELPGIVCVRGLGLMCACDLDDALDAPALVLRGLEAGLLLNSTGPHTLRFLPPLVCTQADVDALIEGLNALLA
ncbi:acetylornithine/succinylornithine family transaminase [Raoultibacter phocaeensis]|uniref:acetylornithine/succinylornithine family transaminase n=1 Tax=Raoultibacter phocaeensis TaxID=2479841 RepID=UPI00111A7B17|nr:acetylornithine/succinylornithine family transaminase [Raoultibacter phocaeensis]